MHTRCRPAGIGRLMLAAAIVALVGFAVSPAFAQKKDAGKSAAKPKLPPLKKPEDKLKFLDAIRLSMPARAVGKNIGFSSADLDTSLENQIKLSSDAYAPLVSDEAFIRRASLDLTGAIPSERVVREFVAREDAKKRAKLVDELLETKEYARNWGRFWRHVILFGSTAPRNRLNPQALEDWLTEQFEKNVRWDHVVSEMVSATPRRDPKNRDDFGQSVGQNNFVLACENKPDELASRTARLFMGISIQCAECHDHPFDKWKHEQFHELAAFFAPGKYYMTDQYDPQKKTQMQAQFLLGEKPPEDLNADARRVALAAYLIYNQDNYWFARAYVNRVWNELLGDGFYSVDSLGPDKDVMHKIVVNRLAAVFRYKEFDPKWLFRLVMNSEAYQRDIRVIDDQAKLFTAVRPSRLRADQLATSVRRVLGDNDNLARAITRTFDVDPSLPQRDVEGSIQQALLLMNNGNLHNQVAKSNLRKRIGGMKNDASAVDELYFGILARQPSKSEKDRALAHLRKAGNRGEAIDDLIWVLLNSSEFMTKR